MRDLLVFKFKGQSRVTVEGYAGYFIIGKDGSVKYKILQYPMSLSSLVTCNPGEGFKQFQRKLNEEELKIIQKSVEFKDTNLDLRRYVKSQLYRDTAFGGKLIKANKSEDFDVIVSMFKDFFVGWVDELKLEIVVEDMDYAGFSKQFSKYGNPEDAMSLLSRSDLSKLSEAYPIVDPINGRSIDSFDIGDNLYFTVLRFSEESMLRTISERFPNAFNDAGDNVEPIIGKIISKEFVPEVGDDFTLIKIECESVYFKALVYNSLNIMAPTVKVPQIQPPKKKSSSSSASGKTFDSAAEKKEKIELSDILMGLFLVVGIIGTIVTIAYFFFTR